MRYHELTELFNSKVNWKWTTQTDESYVGTFDINDITYDVEIGKYSETEWEVVFGADGEFKLTGDLVDNPGAVLAMFSTIAEMVLVFMKKEHPLELVFSADNSEPSRVKLYQRMSKQLAQATGYHLETYIKSGETFFRLAQK